MILLLKTFKLITILYHTRWVALMIQLGEFVGGWWVADTYIQLAGAGSTARWVWINKNKSGCFNFNN